MATSHADITTQHASRYLQQLCKHFGHKVPVEFTAQVGKIDLPFGTCQLTATASALRLQASAADDVIDRTEKVIGDHLARFAFRENPTIAWQRAA